MGLSIVRRLPFLYIFGDGHQFLGRVGRDQNQRLPALFGSLLVLLLSMLPNLLQSPTLEQLNRLQGLLVVPFGRHIP